jgi:hypothetical protein
LDSETQLVQLVELGLQNRIRWGVVTPPTIKRLEEAQ